MLKQFGSTLEYQPGLINERAAEIAAADGQANTNNADVDAAEGLVAEEMKAALMLCMANKICFKPLLNALVNKYVLGEDNCPTMCKQLMGVMKNYKTPKQYQPQVPRDGDHDEDDRLQLMQRRAKDAEETKDGATMVQKKAVKYW